MCQHGPQDNCLSTSKAYQQLLPTHPMMTWLALGSDTARSLMRSRIFVSPSPCTHGNELGKQQAVQACSVLAKGVDTCSSSGAKSAAAVQYGTAMMHQPLRPCTTAQATHVPRCHLPCMPIS